MSKKVHTTVNMIERQKVSQRAASDANQKTGPWYKLKAETAAVFITRKELLF